MEKQASSPAMKYMGGVLVFPILPHQKFLGEERGRGERYLKDAAKGKKVFGTFEPFFIFYSSVFFCFSKKWEEEESGFWGWRREPTPTSSTPAIYICNPCFVFFVFLLSKKKKKRLRTEAPQALAAKKSRGLRLMLLATTLRTLFSPARGGRSAPQV